MGEEIKAKITIEADTSGADEAAAALEKLQGMAGNGGIGDALAQQFAEGTKGAGEFADAVGAIEEPVRTGEQAISEMTDTLGEHQQAVGNVQQAVENVGTSYEDLQKPLGRANESFTTLSKSTADVQAAMEEFNRSDPWASFNTQFSQGGDTGFVAETLWNANYAAKAASANVSSFAVSTEDANKAAQAFLGTDSAQYFSDIGSSATNADKAVSEFLGTTQNTGTAIEDVNKAASKGFFGNLFGEGGTLSEVGNSVGGFFGGIGEAVDGFVMGLNEIAMPLMAVQMLGQMASGVGSWIYNANLAAEGPNASNPLSYTSQASLLAANVTAGGNQFATGIGQGLLPALEGWNAAQGTATNPWQSIGNAIGTALGIGGSGLQMMGGGLSWLLGGGGLFGNNPLVQAGQNWMTSGYEGDVNAVSQMLGQPAPFTPSSGAAYVRAIGQNTYTFSHGGGTFVNVPAPTADIAANEQYFNDMPFNPLAANNNQYMPNRYGAGTYYGGTVTSQDAQSQMNYGAPSNWLGGIGSLISGGNPGITEAGNTVGNSIGSFFSGLSQSFMKLWDPTGDLNNLGASGNFAGGCFVAGTPLLMADGSEKPIEQIRVGDQVLGYDGKKAVPVTIQACITFPHKQTYELTFSDGRTLILTDSHPLFSPDTGWKSLSPAMTKEENPDLSVSMLQVGDVISTVDGTCTLVAIEKKQIEQVYNVTVNGAHTYYANRILTHNIKAGSFGGGAQSIGDQIGAQVSSIQLPHIDLGGIASSLAGSFSGIQLPHLDLGGIGASLGGAFSGIQLPHLDLGGIGSTLGGAFSGIQLPHLDLGGIGSSLAGAFSGIQLPHLDLGGISSSLAGAFSGISIPSIPQIGSQISSQLGNMFSGITMPSIPQIGSQINGALSNMFSGISMPSIPNIGSQIMGALGGMFSGIQMPQIPDIGGMISGAISGIFGSVHMPQIPDFGGMINGAISNIFSGIHIPSIPMFASGVRGFSGGAAIVGEAGMEAVEYNGQYALFDQGATFVNLPSGSSVYPLQDLAMSSSPRQFASGTMGDTTPISLPILSMGGGGPQTANIHVYLDSQTLVQALGMPLASSIRVGMGLRGY